MPRTLSLLVVALTLGCNSSYVPQGRGRIAIVLRNGAPAYVRDGQVYEHGFLGSGLVRAVSGNPGAEAAATEYRERLKTGLLTSLAGLVCSTAALGFALERADRNDQRDVPPELWVSLGCMAASFGGLFYAITAEPYRWDAVNIFNDTQPVSPPSYPTGPSGWSATRKVSLQMRD